MRGFIEQVEGFIFDLDGTLYLGNVGLPYGIEAVALARLRGSKVAFLTNNALHHRRHFAEKLTSMGIPATVSEVTTSARGTAVWLRENFPASSLTAYVVGEEGLFQELSEVGVEIRSDLPVDFVVVGLDRTFSYEKLSVAQKAILNGARFIATNADPVLPTENGLTPGGGSIVAAIACATRTKPRIIGKPRAHLVRQILAGWEISPERCLLIGDGLNSDVAAARASRVRSALVLTGVSSREEVERTEPRRRPDLVFEDLGQFCLRIGG